MISNPKVEENKHFFLRICKVETLLLRTIRKSVLYYFECYDLGDAKELVFENWWKVTI